jgi:hypothetical protein
MQLLRALFVLALAVTAATGRPVGTTGPFLGSWTVSESKPAPWLTAAPTDTPNADLTNARIAFSRSRLEAPAPLGCARALYSFDTVGPGDLFGGYLTDAEAQAKALGFTSNKIIVLSFGCQSGEAKSTPDFAMVDQNTAMFALGNYIYVMKRTP